MADDISSDMTASPLRSATAEALLQSVTLGGVLDLTQWHHMSLAAMSKLLAFAITRARDRTVAPLRLGLSSQSLLRELYWMSFFSLAASDASAEPILNGDELAAREREASAPSRQNMPYRRVAEAGQRRDEFYAHCGTFLTALQQVFENTLPLLGYTQVQIRTFYRPSKEIIENIHLHSGSWGFGGARVDTRGVEITYADVGMGIKASLTANPDYHQRYNVTGDSDEAAILHAFEWGTTGKQGEGRGTGLYEARAFAILHGGSLECRSGTARVVFGRTEPRISTGLVNIPGVQITIFLPNVERA